MLAEAKDTSELMVDLAYAALYFGDPDMAEEVGELQDDLQELASDMRSVCVLSARTPQDAAAMSSVLQVIDCILRIADDAGAIARIVTHQLGIPAELVADLSKAEEVAHRVLVREGSHMAHRPLAGLELPTVTGMRVTAIRRGREWITDDIDGDVVLLPSDVIFLHGPPAGITRIREMAGAPYWQPTTTEDGPALSDLDRAVDVLVEMKNLSEVAVGLAYSALVLRDPLLAAEVKQLEDRLDDMKDRLELWVLRAAGRDLDPGALRGLLHLSQAAEDLGNQAKQMVWLVEDPDDEVHPILAIAFGETDEVVFQAPVAPGARADGASLTELALDVEPGFQVLAIRRAGGYLYRPRGSVVLLAEDELIAQGPYEGREALAEVLGWAVEFDEDTGEMELHPLERVRS